MSKKVKKFGRAAAEIILATAKHENGTVSCSKCAFTVQADTVEGLVRAFNTFEIDHVVPESHGGNSRRENAAVLCGSQVDSASGLRRRGCNQVKGETQPEIFYTPEQLERIRAIQKTEITETEWLFFNETLCRIAPQSAWFKRFAPASLKRELA